MNTARLQRTLSYFKTNLDYNAPYYIILDGNFIKQLISHDMMDPFRRQLCQMLGVPISNIPINGSQSLSTSKFKLMTTLCVCQQLQLLGTSFQLVHAAARKLDMAKCCHRTDHNQNYQGELAGVAKCIQAWIRKERGGNIGNGTTKNGKSHKRQPQTPIQQQSHSKSIIVCTQDLCLRRHLRQNYPCPLLYFGPDQRITCQQISHTVQGYTQQKNVQKYKPMSHQLEEISQWKKDEKVKRVQEWKTQVRKMAGSVGLKAKFKIPKGPNPLACKKKNKNKNHNQELNDNEQGDHSIGQIKKTKPIRKDNNGATGQEVTAQIEKDI